jgi:hypothetical protein
VAEDLGEVLDPVFPIDAVVPDPGEDLEAMIRSPAGALSRPGLFAGCAKNKT